MPALHVDRHSLLISLFLLTTLLTGWIVFAPGLNGPFMLDDFDNLGALEVGVTDFQSFDQYMSRGNAGPLDRPISKLTFLLNDNAWPSDPESFKRTNILIHLLLGVVLFALLRLVGRKVTSSSGADWVAVFATALWLLHPFQVSTVLYAVQRMTQLSALFIVIGVVVHGYLRERDHAMELKTLILLSLNLGGFMLLAAFSKENGVLLPVFIAVLELTILANNGGGFLFKWWRRLAIWLPSICLILYLLYLPRWQGGYDNRDFTLYERALTEPVVLWSYLQSIFTFQVYKLGLFQDDFPVYSTFANPVVWAAILGHAALIGLASVLRHRHKVFAFGVLWFYTGHLIESTTVGLEIYFEHRNYLSLAGLAFAFVAILHFGFQRASKEFSRFYYVFVSALLVIVASITWGFAGEWGDEDRIIPIWAAEHPESPRAQRAFAQHLANRGFPQAALDHLDRSYETFSHDLSIPFMSAGISCAFDRKLRFDPEDLRARIDGHRWTDGLRPAAAHLEELMDIPRCSALAPEFASVLERLESFDKAQPSATASLFVIAGDIYLNAGDGDSALRLYKKVDQIRPSPSSATRIAGLFLGAGKYREARRALEVAIERDSASGISDVKMAEYIRNFERIDRELEEGANLEERLSE